jgi:hypothetical protein
MHESGLNVFALVGATLRQPKPADNAHFPRCTGTIHYCESSSGSARHKGDEGKVTEKLHLIEGFFSDEWLFPFRLTFAFDFRPM